jgi:hypothetical protein
MGAADVARTGAGVIRNIERKKNGERKEQPSTKGFATPP